jgi:hypothetical protein
LSFVTIIIITTIIITITPGPAVSIRTGMKYQNRSGDVVQWEVS